MFHLRRVFLLSAYGCALFTAVGISMGLQAQEGAPTKTATLAARDFLGSLTTDQKKLAQIPFGDQRRLEWHFIPMETRKGMPIRDMNEQQAILAIQVLRSVTSEKGFKRATDIMSYEAILLELEGPAAAKRRDYKKYYLAIYGEPSDQSQWGLSFEGHHMSLNFTLDRGVIVDATPEFFGLNPAKLPKSFTTPSSASPGQQVTFKEGNRVLSLEEDAGLALLDSLNDAQKAKAIFNTQCPEDILWAGEAQPKPITAVGIPAIELNPDQKRLLMNLIDAYQSAMPKDVVSARRNLINASGIDSIHFAWAGATNLGGQRYFRLQGPTFIAEFSNFQADSAGNKANHIHSVWRDMTGDFNLPISGK